MRDPRVLCLSLVPSMALMAGCGGTPSEIDTAETIRPDAPKPATPPAAAPEAPATKDAPKG